MAMIAKPSRVLITGATGRLGHALFEHFSSSDVEVIGTFGNHARPGFEHLDLTSESSLLGVLDRVRPDAVIHAGAMTDVDACERDEALAMRINAESSEILASQAQRRGIRYVYISTDYVFDGESGPYYESSKPNPISVYGRSKWAGEQAALACTDGSVVRVAILYGHTQREDCRTFVDQVVDAARQGKTVRLDGKRLKYPTLTDDVARAVETLLDTGKAGIFHLAYPSGMTRFQWGLAIAEAFDLDRRQIVRDDTVELGKPARRPFDVRLCDTRLGFVHTMLSAGLGRIRRRRVEERAA